MTHLERILATFKGKECDVIPWFADLTYWYNAELYHGTLPQKYRGLEGTVDLYKDLGCGGHEHLLDLPCKVTYTDVEIVVTEEGDNRITEWHTPIGTLRQTNTFSARSYSSAIVDYPVKTVEDLKILRFILENQKVTPDYSRQEEMIAAWGGYGAASSLPPRTPFANLLVGWSGVLHTTYLLADDPMAVEETLEVMAATDDPIYDIVCQSPAPLVYFGDNITSDVVSPKIFKKYYAPYYKKRAEQLHKFDKHIFVHIDGAVKGVLPLIADTGVDCAQSLTPYPAGDATIEEFRKLAGSDVVLWGGLPGAFFSEMYPEEILLDSLMECLRLYRDDGKFIIGVADQVPPDGVIERVAKVSEIVEKYGRLG
jgi:SAM-dependent methyltransferase